MSASGPRAFAIKVCKTVLSSNVAGESFRHLTVKTSLVEDWHYLEGTSKLLQRIVIRLRTRRCPCPLWDSRSVEELMTLRHHHFKISDWNKINRVVVLSGTRPLRSVVVLSTVETFAVLSLKSNLTVKTLSIKSSEEFEILSWEQNNSEMNDMQTNYKQTKESCSSK